MTKNDVRSVEQALVYLTDCTLATVSSMAMLKSRKKYEYERQKRIAETGLRWIKKFDIEPDGRPEVVLKLGISVDEWARRYEPQ